MSQASERIRLALADDHTLVRQGFISLIKHLADDIEVVADAGSGSALLDALALLPRLPDVCLLDMSMPGMNGYETQQALKARFPTVRVIALTHYQTESVVLAMIRGGVQGFLLKEIDTEEFLVAIREAASGDSFYYTDTATGAMARWVRHQSKAHPADLNDIERRFLTLCTTDATYNAIASELGISKRAVEALRNKLFERLSVNSRTGLAMYAVQSALAAA